MRGEGRGRNEGRRRNGASVLRPPSSDLEKIKGVQLQVADHEHVGDDALWVVEEAQGETVEVGGG